MGLEEKLEGEVSKEKVIERVKQIIKKIKETDDKEKIKKLLLLIRKLISLLPPESRKDVLKFVLGKLKDSKAMSGVSIPLPSPEAIEEIRFLRSGEERSNLIQKLDISPGSVSPGEEEEEALDVVYSSEELYGGDIYETEDKFDKSLYTEEEAAGVAYESEGPTSAESTAGAAGTGTPEVYEKKKEREEEDELGYLEKR